MKFKDCIFPFNDIVKAEFPPLRVNADIREYLKLSHHRTIRRRGNSKAKGTHGEGERGGQHEERSRSKGGSSRSPRQIMDKDGKCFVILVIKNASAPFKTGGKVKSQVQNPQITDICNHLKLKLPINIQKVTYVCLCVRHISENRRTKLDNLLCYCPEIN